MNIAARRQMSVTVPANSLVRKGLQPRDLTLPYSIMYDYCMALTEKRL